MSSLYDCTSDDSTCEIEYTITVVVFVLIFALLGWFFPIKDTTGNKNKLLSVLVSVILFPLYVIILSVQFPYVDSGGTEQPVLTLLVALFFWPATFFIVNTKEDKRVKDISMV